MIRAAARASRRARVGVAALGWAFGAVAVLVGATPAASQQPAERASARLSWARLPGAEGCPDGAALASDVAWRLGYDPFARSTPGFFVEGAVRPTADGFEADLIFRRARGEALGERHIESANGAACEALGRAAALAIAVALDPEAALALPETRSDASPEASSEAASEGSLPAAPTPPSPQARDREAPPGEGSRRQNPPAPGPELAASIRLELQFGTLPMSTFVAGAGLSAALRWPTGVRVALGVFYLPSAELDGIGFSLAAAWAEGCYEPDVAARLRLGACARLAGGAHLAFVDVRGVVPSNVEAFDAGEHAWWSAGPAFRLHVRLPAGLFVDAEAGVMFGLVRNTFVVTRTEGGEVVGEDVYREPTAAVAGALAMGVAFD